MRLKNLDKVWHRNESCSIFNLPFACYSVQPLFHSGNLKLNDTQKYVVSFKASILFPEPMDNIFDTVTEAEIACENHLTKLMEYLFGKMEDIIELDCDTCNFETVNSRALVTPKV